MRNSKGLIKFFKNQWFVAGIFVTLALGMTFPSVNEILNPDSITSTIIILILFFNTGLTIPTESIVKGLANYRLHIFIQLFVFIVTPLCFYLCITLFKDFLTTNMIIGFFALSVLPPTISSCIVFTHSCRGNSVGAMFNTSLANIMGILLSPLLLSLLLKSSEFQSMSGEFFNILLKLFLIMFLPVSVGQVLHQFLKKSLLEYKQQITTLNNVLILIMSLFAFSGAASNGNIFAELSFLPFLILAIMNPFLTLLAYSSAKLLKFSKEDLVSIIFTTPQKTVAMGIPLISAFFAAAPKVLAIAIIPLLFYYAWQLLVAALVKSIFYKD
jgi:sodium/bile acid cotransporter 7